MLYPNRICNNNNSNNNNCISINNTTTTGCCGHSSISSSSCNNVDSIGMNKLMTNDMVLDTLYSYIGVGYYRYISGVNTQFYTTYAHYLDHSTRCTLKSDSIESNKNTNAAKYSTTLQAAVSSLSTIQIWYNETNNRKSSIPKVCATSDVNDQNQYRHSIVTAAVAHNKVDVLEWLHHTFGAIWQDDAENFYCLAVGHNSYECLDYMHETASAANVSKLLLQYLCYMAVQDGHLRILQYLCETMGQSPPQNTSVDFDVLFMACRVASVHGQLSCLKYIYTTYLRTNERAAVTELYTELCYHAAIHTQLPCLQYIVETIIYNSNVAAAARGISAAAARGISAAATTANSRESIRLQYGDIIQAVISKLNSKKQKELLLQDNTIRTVEYLQQQFFL